MGKGRVWKFHKAVHHDFEVFVPRKRPTPVPRQTYFLSFFRTTIVSPCPQHAGLTETKADATETKPQNLRSQTGLRGQHSTALNRFQPDHKGSACADETQSVRKLPSPHYHVRISAQSGDSYFARHNQCRAQGSPKDCTFSGCFWKLLSLSLNSDGVPTSYPLKVSLFSPLGKSLKHDLSLPNSLIKA